jgi:ribosomal protein L11 methyltransferase
MSNEGSSYVLKLRIPKKIKVSERAEAPDAPIEVPHVSMDREVFTQWLWDEFLSEGLQGIHEGTLLSQEAADKGLETESWTLDAAEAPRERDWVADQSENDAELYFETLAGAEKAAARLRSMTDAGVGEIAEQKQEDWDAQWKASFLGSENGVPVPPFWRILPPWVEPTKVLNAGERALKINPGAGFGTGTHETTQLCLQAIGEASQLKSLAGAKVLDFGSGSGILAIGAGLLGAEVDAVEIDPLAIDNALENAKLNGVESRLNYSRAMASDVKPYRLVIANILRPVLLEFSERLVARIDSAPGSGLILSGLIESDVKEVRERFSALLGGLEPQVRELNEWRALIWKK